MTAFVFAGQGAQRKGMGGALFDEFAELSAKADAVLGYSIRELCLQDPKRQLGLTQYTQPAMYVVNALHYFKRLKQSTAKPDAAAGHSLGEYNALLAAEAFDFETGLRLVQKRGELIAQCGGGAMAAVLGLGWEAVSEALRQGGLAAVDLANHNTPSQVVIAGSREDILRAQKVLQAAGAASCIPLNVSGPFHSRHMRPAQGAFAAFLDGFRFSALRLPVVSNVHARFYRDDEIKACLAEQIASPVRWVESIQLLARGGETRFEEIGPAEIAMGMVRKILEESPPPIPMNRERERERERPAGCPDDTAHDTAHAHAHAHVDSVIRPPAPGPSAPVVETPRITADRLGSDGFRADHGVRYAYAAGALPLGMSGVALVVRMARAGLLASFGAAGIEPGGVEAAIRAIQRDLPAGQVFGASLVPDALRPDAERALVELYLRLGVRTVEVSGYVDVSAQLVRLRAQGLGRAPDGSVAVARRVLACVGRPEVAERLLSPPPAALLRQLVEARQLGAAEAEAAAALPLVDDLCVESDGAGRTERRSAFAVLPVVRALVGEVAARFPGAARVRVGLSGGLGTPQAIAAAFVLGADFVLTRSINQCTVEAGLGDAAKDLLERAEVQDTDHVPGPDLDAGPAVQVLRTGGLFAARAHKLLELYRHHESWEATPPRLRARIQDQYLRRGFEDVARDLEAQLPPAARARAGREPRYRMGLVFGWYLDEALRLATLGEAGREIDFQIPCGPALGACNRWLRGTPRASWRGRHVDELAGMLMEGAAAVLGDPVGRGA